MPCWFVVGALWSTGFCATCCRDVPTSGSVDSSKSAKGHVVLPSIEMKFTEAYRRSGCTSLAWSLWSSLGVFPECEGGRQGGRVPFRVLEGFA